MSPPNFARTIYRALLQVSARRAIGRMLANGLPPWLGPALSHLSRPVIAVSEQRILEPIDGFRTALRDRTDEPPKVFYSPEPQNRETGETNRVTPGSFEHSAWEWDRRPRLRHFLLGRFFVFVYKAQETRNDS